MNNDKLITFSVAAYNVSNYLAELLDSIVTMKHREFVEVLVVNDGSKDNTSQIGHEYENLYPGIIRVIDKDNGGYGSTINQGIAQARGTYFKVLDGDDWVDTDETDLLIEELQNTSSDMLFTSCKDIYYDKNGKVIKTYVDDFDYLDSGKVYTFEELQTLIPWIRFHKIIYKTNILRDNNIHIDEKCFYTDSEFSILPIMYIYSVKYLRLCVYNYRIYGLGQSVSTYSRKKNISHSQKVVKRLLAFRKTIPQSMLEGKRKYINYGIAMSCCWYFYGLLLFAPDKDYKKKMIEFDKDLYLEHRPIYDLMREVNGKNRIIILLRCSGYLAYWLIGLKNIIKGE